MSYCGNCEVDLNTQDDYDECDNENVRCDFCQTFFNRYQLCRFCYYKPYPLRACPVCMQSNGWARKHITAFEEVIR